jgi:hypothetical protein
MSFLEETSELKTPKIDRRRVFVHDEPNTELGTRYLEHAELNLAIDVFLKEVEAFVKQQYEEEMPLFKSIPGVSLSITAAEMDKIAKEPA